MQIRFLTENEEQLKWGEKQDKDFNNTAYKIEELSFS